MSSKLTSDKATQAELLRLLFPDNIGNMSVEAFRRFTQEFLVFFKPLLSDAAAVPLADTPQAANAFDSHFWHERASFDHSLYVFQHNHDSGAQHEPPIMDSLSVCLDYLRTLEGKNG